MPIEFAQHLAAADLPEFASHVIGNAGDETLIRAENHPANPALVRFHRADRLAFLGIPPDQFAVPTPGYQCIPGQNHAADIAGVPF